jgi:2-C-methyl-D-erythritol 4-phosphate cytidylyltransferase
MSTYSVILLTVAPPNETAEKDGPFVKIDGRETLLRSTELFLNRDNIKQILLVFTPEMLEEGKRKYGSHLSFSGVKVASGGPKWIDQIVAAAEKISPDTSHVIIHDAARCAVAYNDLDALLDTGLKKPAVALAAPIKAGLVEVDESGSPVGERSGKEFMQLLTPRSYSKEKFNQVVQAKQDLHPSEWTLLRSSALNIRASGPEASLVNSMLKHLPKPKIKASNNPFEEAQW